MDFDWLLGFIVFDGMRSKKKEKPMVDDRTPAYINQRDVQNMAPWAREQLAREGLIPETPVVELQRERERRSKKPLLPHMPKRTVVVGRKQTNGFYQLAGWLILGVGATLHLIGTVLVAIGGAIFKAGVRLRDKGYGH